MKLLLLLVSVIVAINAQAFPSSYFLNLPDMPNRFHLTAQQLIDIVDENGGYLSTTRANELIDHLNAALYEFGIDKGYNRLIQFLAHILHETGNLQWFTELGSTTCPGATCCNYDGGCDYRGRGALQLTHIGNYRAAGYATGLDLVNNPDLVANDDLAFRVSGMFWTARSLSVFCDVEEWEYPTWRISGCGGNDGLGSAACATREKNIKDNQRAAVVRALPSEWAARPVVQTEYQECFAMSSTSTASWNGRHGWCMTESDCSGKQGTWRSGYCSKQPSDVRCCVNMVGVDLFPELSAAAQSTTSTAASVTSPAMQVSSDGAESTTIETVTPGTGTNTPEVSTAAASSTATGATQAQTTVSNTASGGGGDTQTQGSVEEPDSIFSDPVTMGAIIAAAVTCCIFAMVLVGVCVYCATRKATEYPDSTRLHPHSPERRSRSESRTGRARRNTDTRSRGQSLARTRSHSHMQARSRGASVRALSPNNYSSNALQSHNFSSNTLQPPAPSFGMSSAAPSMYGSASTSDFNLNRSPSGNLHQQASMARIPPPLPGASTASLY